MAVSTIQVGFCAGKKPIPTPMQAGEVCHQRHEFEIATTSIDDVGDIVEALVLPANCVPIEATIWADDLDSNGTPALVLNMGVTSDPDDPAESDTKKDLDAFIASSTVGQAGGKAQSNVITLPQFDPVERPLRVGISVGTAAAIAASGTVIVEMTYRHKNVGE